ncbi:hypothetical protein J2X69_003603 [Algoriphagus sp. 4150]|uniref:DUF4374 domain-containing protein n=1 Tax=Algoriphagus sp. 4150 TaxID=2817756 RepID=UPI00285E2DFF|nr:DUF4374 domain-containing protein [Algoriphagus sp. 4150]MDR7131242.1 hypothetical protein [Algoriphagus sp. 4150]
MKNNLISKIGVFVVSYLLISCGNDDPTPDIDRDKDKLAKYALITRVANADQQTAAFYLQSLSSLEISGTVDNRDAEEVVPASGVGAYSHDGYVYINDYVGSRIQKWKLTAANKATLLGSVNVTELGYQGNILFKDTETAFVGGTSQSSIVIFNPTTMQKTGKIDFSAWSRLNEVTGFPATGTAINIESVTELLISGKYMYAALNYINDFASYTPATSACAIMVIDLEKVNVNSNDNSEAVLSIISDERASFAGSWNSGGGSYFMQKDENGDVYILCHNLWGNQRATFGKPAAILRIKSGMTEFDTGYYFDLESASKGNGNPVLNFEYYGNGKFLAAVQDPNAINPENPWSYYLDPIFQWWSFDLYSKSAERVSSQLTKGALSARCVFEGNNAYVPFETNEESYIMKINLGSMTSSKTFSTNGSPVLMGLE